MNQNAIGYLCNAKNIKVSHKLEKRSEFRAFFYFPKTVLPDFFLSESY